MPFKPAKTSRLPFFKLSGNNFSITPLQSRRSGRTQAQQDLTAQQLLNAMAKGEQQKLTNPLLLDLLKTQVSQGDTNLEQDKRAESERLNTLNAEAEVNRVSFNKASEVLSNKNSSELEKTISKEFQRELGPTFVSGDPALIVQAGARARDFRTKVLSSPTTFGDKGDGTFQHSRFVGDQQIFFGPITAGKDLQARQRESGKAINVQIGNVDRNTTLAQLINRPGSNKIFSTLGRTVERLIRQESAGKDSNSVIGSFSSILAKAGNLLATDGNFTPAQRKNISKIVTLIRDRNGSLLLEEGVLKGRTSKFLLDLATSVFPAIGDNLNDVQSKFEVGSGRIIIKIKEGFDVLLNDGVQSNSNPFTIDGGLNPAIFDGLRKRASLAGNTKLLENINKQEARVKTFLNEVNLIGKQNKAGGQESNTSDAFIKSSAEINSLRGVQ